MVVPHSNDSVWSIDNALKVVAQDKASSVLILELPGKSSAKCELQFRPCQVNSSKFLKFLSQCS